MAEPSLIRHLERARDAVSRRLEGDLAPLALSLPEAHVLLVVAERERLPLADVRRSVERSGSTMTGLVDRMVERGLIERVPAVGDRRAIDLVATAEGRRAGADIEHCIAAAEADLAAAIPPKRRAALVADLDAVARAAGDG